MIDLLFMLVRRYTGDDLHWHRRSFGLIEWLLRILFAFWKKPELVLHIGRHKTGTTAVQQFLAAHRPALHDRGYFVPEYYHGQIGHHLFAMELKRESAEDNKTISPSPLLEGLYSIAAKTRGQTTIISSEVFQNIDPGLVAETFCRFDVRVILYLRNQLDYLTSSYAQRVHATDYAESLEEYAENLHKVDYAAFLGNWEARFPKKLTVRKFERKSLVGGDIVDDFIQYGLHLDAGDFPEDTEQTGANPSLNEKVIQFKLHLNRTGATALFDRQKLYRALPKLNAQFPAGTLKTNLQLKNRMLEQCLMADSRVAREYFNEDSLFSYDDYQARELEALDECEIVAMDEVLRGLIA